MANQSAGERGASGTADAGGGDPDGDEPSGSDPGSGNLTGGDVLVCHGLRKTYGERIAVDGVG